MVAEDGKLNLGPGINCQDDGVSWQPGLESGDLLGEHAIGIVPAKHLGGFNPTRKLLERTSSRPRIFYWELS